MTEKVVRLFLQWEPIEPGATDGLDHIYAKVEQSNIPTIQSLTYLCGLQFTEEPDIDALVLENMLAPGSKRQILLKNMCPKCLEELEQRFPSIKQ